MKTYFKLRIDQKWWVRPAVTAIAVGLWLGLPFNHHHAACLIYRHGISSTLVEAA